MEILDQSEVDALLSSSSQGPGEADFAEEDASDGDCPQFAAHLPPGFELVADTSQIERIKPVKVPVIVRLAERQMSLNKILDITVGTIVEFDKPADAELDLVVNNVVIGTGNAVKCGENFGLRIIKIEPWAQRLVAAGLYR